MYSLFVLSLSCYYLFCFIRKVGDVRVRFSYAGLSGETSQLGPAQTVSATDDLVNIHLRYYDESVNI